MERTKDNQKREGALYWIRTTGRGTLIIDGKKKKIKPSQKFWALPEEVPEAFRDVIKTVDPEQAPPREGVPEPIEVNKLTYTAKHIGGGRYHVIDSNGKQVTDKSLHGKPAVEELIASLSG